ncbi:BTAD domain-containing putative transcriptional regulator [Lentzea sp. BCCO 10_0061]|uniref:BTAD domain-containing putative transcriptional regulator n=1 Tax=Lentzea sokolovensis TaxID=3095429 RepID=A0ABU4UP99_9PSEU|nr:BTAD domain-containing putative transcriptional regulator [Lentzea sp. BCCO 10_0061]MDX8141313.1 BTAD domain-containing putative transcriptional regulator [Lentzea sp. BCCO 10_0061]
MREKTLMTNALEFGLLGDLEVLRNGVRVPLGTGKLRVVLATLLLRVNHTVSIDELIERLWGETPPRQAKGTAQVYVMRLRRLLDADLIRTRPGGYRFETPECRIDVGRFRELAENGAPHEALALWRGRALADVPSESLQRDEVPRLAEERLRVVGQRVDLDLGLGLHAELVGELTGLIEEHPYQERFRGQLMRALHRSGRQAEALDTYRRFRATLIDELGVEPSAELRAAHESILRAETESNLPAEVTSFVGRTRELREVAATLSASRLVTLIGGGGVGKSRLALRAAHAYPDAAWFVELAGLHDPALLHHTIADVLSIPRHSTEDPLSVLTKYLRDRQLLLVLDNCEHLVDACAALVTALLRAAPGLRVLVTSRHALRVAGEHIMVVDPLDVGEESVELFRHRAAAVQAGFTGDAGLVERICARLEGIPLAIELAAVRTRLLGLAQILDGLEDRYQLLAGGRRGGPPHHQTLRAAVDLSYELCTPAERALWARLSVFAGSFDLDAVKAVCEPVSPVTPLDLVDELLDKSVLSRVERDGFVRFRMLDTIRQYGRDKLRCEGDDARFRRMHRDYFVQLAEQGDAEWFGSRQEAVFVRTRLEHANLREALDFCFSTPGESPIGVHLAGALWFYWVGCGFLAEGRHWLDRALAVDSAPTPQRAKALWVNGYIATLQGDIKPAVAMLEECRDTAPDEVSLAYAVHRLGCNALVGDDVSEAVALLEDARARYAALGEMNSNVVLAYVELAVAWIWLGDLARSAALCEEIGVVCEEKGELWAYAYVRYGRGVVRMSAGDLEGASADADACLRIKHTLHDQLGMVLAVELLAWTATEARQYERAAVLLGAARHMWSAVGYALFGSRHFTAPHQACLDRVRSSLGDEAFGLAIARGAELSVDQAVAFALDRTHLA